jgi:hypothetical protein
MGIMTPLQQPVSMMSRSLDRRMLYGQVPKKPASVVPAG